MSPRLFKFVVRDKSMEPYLYPGDVTYVEPTENIQDGDLILVEYKGKKRIRWFWRNQLIFENRKWWWKTVPWEVEEGVQILGKVVEIRRKVKRKEFKDPRH